MDISQLPKIVKRSKKRLGRGHGSGKVKTAGRGTKGQKARDSIKPGFEGGQVSIIKRLPLLRGKGRNKSRKERVVPVNVDSLNAIPAGTRVTLETLEKYHMIRSGTRRVKIVGKGTLKHALDIAVPMSKKARKASGQE